MKNKTETKTKPYIASFYPEPLGMETPKDPPSLPIHKKHDWGSVLITPHLLPGVALAQCTRMIFQLWDGDKKANDTVEHLPETDLLLLAQNKSPFQVLEFQKSHTTSALQQHLQRPRTSQGGSKMLFKQQVAPCRSFWGVFFAIVWAQYTVRQRCVCCSPL